MTVLNNKDEGYTGPWVEGEAVFLDSDPTSPRLVGVGRCPEYPDSRFLRFCGWNGQEKRLRISKEAAYELMRLLAEDLSRED